MRGGCLSSEMKNVDHPTEAGECVRMDACLMSVECHQDEGFYLIS